MSERYDSEADNRSLLRAILRWEYRDQDRKREMLIRLAKMSAEMIRQQTQQIGS